MKYPCSGIRIHVPGSGCRSVLFPRAEGPEICLATLRHCAMGTVFHLGPYRPHVLQPALPCPACDWFLECAECSAPIPQLVSCTRLCELSHLSEQPGTLPLTTPYIVMYSRIWSFPGGMALIRELGTLRQRTESPQREAVLSGNVWPDSLDSGTLGQEPLWAPRTAQLGETVRALESNVIRWRSRLSLQRINGTVPGHSEIHRCKGQKSHWCHFKRGREPPILWKRSRPRRKQHLLR